MANVYFCQPLASSLGMLRAALSPEECEIVVGQYSNSFLGSTFPTLLATDKTDFAVLGIAPSEAQGKLRSGFYRLDSTLADLDNFLRSLGR
jgi:hypothetical protein